MIHLLTGTGSGIGQVLADRLVARGDEVHVVARSDARAEELRSVQAGLAGVLVADLADPTAVERLADQLPTQLDSLVHAAGVVDLNPVAELDAAELRHQLDVNLVAPAVLTRHCLPALRAARGTVVFVNSGAGITANPQWGAYAASKFGLRAIADSLRAEEAGEGVRVTSVFPGRTATPMQAKVHAQESKAYDAAAWIRPETVVDAIVAALDLPRDATMPEVMIRPTPGS